MEPCILPHLSATNALAHSNNRRAQVFEVGIRRQLCLFRVFIHAFFLVASCMGAYYSDKREMTTAKVANNSDETSCDGRASRRARQSDT